MNQKIVELFKQKTGLGLLDDLKPSGSAGFEKIKFKIDLPAVLTGTRKDYNPPAWEYEFDFNELAKNESVQLIRKVMLFLVCFVSIIICAKIVRQY